MAFAKPNIYHEHFLAALAHYAGRKMHIFEAREVSNALWSITILRKNIVSPQWSPGPGAGVCVCVSAYNGRVLGYSFMRVLKCTPCLAMCESIHPKIFNTVQVSRLFQIGSK